jgi:hypothetical protein
VPGVQYHLQLWQDLQLPRTLLDQAAVVVRKSTIGPTQRFLEACTAASEPFAVLAGEAGLSAQQQELVALGMRVPLLLMDVAQGAVNNFSSSSSSSSSSNSAAPGHTEGLKCDRFFVCSLIEAASLQLQCWRLLDTASSSDAASSSRAAASSGRTATTGAALDSGSCCDFAAATPPPVLISSGMAQLNDCWEVLQQQLVQTTRSVLITPLQAAGDPETAAAAAVVSVPNPQAYATPRGSSSSSSSSSESSNESSTGSGSGSNNSSSSGGTNSCSTVQGMQEPGQAAALSAWSDRLYVVRSLLLVLKTAADQQQQQQQQQEEDTFRRPLAEIMQLLQQHLRTVIPGHY